MNLAKLKRAGRHISVSKTTLFSLDTPMVEILFISHRETPIKRRRCTPLEFKKLITSTLMDQELIRNISYLQQIPTAITAAFRLCRIPINTLFNKITDTRELEPNYPWWAEYSLNIHRYKYHLKKKDTLIEDTLDDVESINSANSDAELEIFKAKEWHLMLPEDSLVKLLQSC